MKIIVFGATGGVGQHVVREAVAAGHEVTAFVRTPEKLEARNDVRVIRGDAFDDEAVANALAGQDAVISCLASSAALKRSNELERMTSNIVTGMRQAGVDRIAYCASAGVDGELSGVVGKSVAWVLRHALADHRAAIELIRAGGLDLTVARPAALSNAEFDPDYVETFIGMPAATRPISRAAVANFLVKAISQPETYAHSSVGLSPA